MTLTPRNMTFYAESPTSTCCYHAILHPSIQAAWDSYWPSIIIKAVQLSCDVLCKLSCSAHERLYWHGNQVRPHIQEREQKNKEEPEQNEASDFDARQVGKLRCFVSNLWNASRWPCKDLPACAQLAPWSAGERCHSYAAYVRCMMS